MSAPTPEPTAASPLGVAERLRLLWSRGERPDVDAFLTAAGPLEPEEVAAVLRVDQRQRWQLGERIPAEDYLRRHPLLHTNPEAAVDLVYGEFLLREQLSEQPDVAHYLGRFPEYAEVLRAQIELHRAMKTGASGTLGGEAGAEPTTPYRGTAPANDPGGRVPMGLVPRAGLRATHEVQTLLRKRLRVLALIAVGISLLFFALNFSRHPLDTRTVWLVYVPGGVFLAVNTVVAVMLWRLDAYSLRRLRVYEGVMFAGCVTYVAWVQYHTFFLTNAWFLQFSQRQAVDISLLARHASITWLVIIVGYGTFIPNTGRRCATVTILMALVPLTLTALGGFFHPEIPARLVVICLIEMFIFMATAVTMAIFGSHKINALRQEALEARKLGQYQLKQRLGAGGMGEVYMAEHALLRRPCAVKLIRPEQAGDPQHLHRFEREVQATAALTHPNTIEIFDYGHADDGTFYYVMEYLPGLSLEELIVRHGPTPLGRAIHLLRQVCGALREAHAAGLVHRDIKPGNILTCERGGRHDVAKLLDFGLVRVHSLGTGADNRTQPGTIAGTPAYMSPEQAAGRTDVDGRSDLYSLGAVAYFLLTGRPPFVRGTAVQTLSAHLAEPVELPSRFRSGLPDDLEAVVLRCLEKEPARRFPDTEALEQALARCGCAGAWSWAEAAAWWREYGNSASDGGGHA